MKIAIIAHALHPIAEPYAGGLEMITHLLCNQLVASGHQVDLYAHKDSSTSANLIPMNAMGMKLEMVEQYLDEQSGNGQEVVRENLLYAKVMNNISEGGYDLIHNHSLHYLPIIMGNIITTPMITSLHTPPFPWLQMGTIAIKGSENQTFTVVSKRLGEIWSDYINEYQVIYNGINLDSWKFYYQGKRDYFVFCGRICVEKGIEEAIEFSIQCNMPLKIIGPISSPEYFETVVAPYLDHPLISYEGHKKQECINTILGNALATLFFSTWEEPYGLVIAESLASGTPVVAYDLGAAPEILTNKTGILLRREEEVNHSIIVDDLRQLSRVACRRRAEQFCGHAQMIQNYEDVYETVAYENNVLKIQSA